jgi:4'-phosphopantetheinyl transferase
MSNNSDCGAMSDWPLRTQPDRLCEAEVHLCVVSLVLTPQKLSDFEGILSPEERKRAGLFQKALDAQRYVAARGSLRSLLGAYLMTEPDRLQFSYDAFGKPQLASKRAFVSFSVSHSDDWGLLGFSRGHRIGVDLERIRTEIDTEDLAKRFFSPNEFRKLRTLPADQQREAFYCGWTRKEAYLKGRGEGLSYGLDRVEVSLAPGEPATIMKASDDPKVSQCWTVQHLSPEPGYVGAAAVEASNIKFKCFKWEPV